MSKNILIVGGGISGLSVLHYLHQKHLANDVTITLLESQEHCGGTVHTIEEEDVHFETGPNGFLNNKPRTLDLVKSLDLDAELISADASSKIRYIVKNGRLQSLPDNPKSLLSSSFFNPIDKLRILAESLIPKSSKYDESVYDFARRRFGKTCAEYVMDPFVTGIYGANAKMLHYPSAFPKVYQLEQEYGSIIKAMKKRRKSASANTSLSGTLMSFKKGMGTLLSALEKKYQHEIICSQKVHTISKNSDKWIVYTDSKQYIADEIFLCTPAYVTSMLLNSISEKLSKDLLSIAYSSITVVGLVFDNQTSTQPLPNGFGYLVPSKEKEGVLGVIFEHNIFKSRTKSKLFYRIMIEGSHEQETAINIAKKELENRLKISSNPENIFYKRWDKAIPQYNMEYPKLKARITSAAQEHRRLHLCANYLDGISFNDCIENAYQKAHMSTM